MLSMNDDRFSDMESDPTFNTALGAVLLLDNLFRLASGYLLGEQNDKYFNTLESIYIELIYWIEQKVKKDVREKEIKELNKLRNSAKSLNIMYLKEYHIKLNFYANFCGLRLKSDARIPGVIGGN